MSQSIGASEPLPPGFGPLSVAIAEIADLLDVSKIRIGQPFEPGSVAKRDLDRERHFRSVSTERPVREMQGTVLAYLARADECMRAIALLLREDRIALTPFTLALDGRLGDVGAIVVPAVPTRQFAPDAVTELRVETGEAGDAEVTHLRAATAER